MRAFRLGFEMEQMSPARHLTFRDVPGSAAELRAAVDAFTGSVVKIDSLSGWYASTYVGARRY